MSTVFSNDDNLPGVITEIENDYTYGYDTSQFGTTDSLLVIGTAFDGPVGVPTAIYSPEHSRYIFGDTYSSKKRQEATLVAGIQDAWDRGCRTIYACRVGGKEMYKDFRLAVDNGLYLRISSRYPSNIGKQVFMRYDGSVGHESISLYKPASRATIAEKKRGEVVSSAANMVSTINLNDDYSIGKDANLVEVIRLFNESDANNVMKLSIVNEKGVDVTDSIEAYALPLGLLYSGVYFMAHDNSLCKEVTETKMVIADGVNTPYSNFDHKFFTKLVINTDVNQPYPIHFDSSKKKVFAEIIHACNITMNMKSGKEWDFLDTLGMAERAFAADSVDYEETKMSSFEMYKRLGSGFAVTAHATPRGENQTPRVSETASDDDNRIVPISDGIYSMLENAEIKYRVLTCASADEKISSKLPRAEEFKITKAESVDALGKLLTLTSNVDKDDKSAARKFEVQFVDRKEQPAQDLKELYTAEVFKVAANAGTESIAEAKLAPGTLVIAQSTTTKHVEGGKDEVITTTTLNRVDADGTVERINDDSYNKRHFIVDNKIFVAKYDKTTGLTIEEVADASFGDKRFVVAEAMNTAFVYELQEGSAVKPVGDLNTMFGETESETAAMITVAASDLAYGTNHLTVFGDFDNITVTELVEAFNSHPVSRKLFTADLTELSDLLKDLFVNEALLEAAKDESDADNGKNVAVVLEADRKSGYDYSLYIPYRTTDNFTRQFAQHLTYVELKTAATHGFIGAYRQTDTGLAAIANRVSELTSKNFDLYAKNSKGRNMLGADNIPYAIGRNVSIVFGQYYVPLTAENYTYLSNGAAGYAGMVSTLPLDQSSTSQSIAIDAITFNLTQSQLIKLTKAGIVTFKKSFTKGIVVTDGITAAPVDSAFRRLAAWRVMGAVETLIREGAEPFIGKQNHVTNRNALTTAIKSRLEKIKGTLIEQYAFDMIVDPSSLKFSYININYKIVPIYEIREIRNNIAIKDSLDSATVTVS